MKIKTTSTKKRKKVDSFAYDYENIGLDQLLIFCAKRIVDRNEDCIFEKLVYECFSLFPQKYSLFYYPHWPDSSRVDKSWRRCRSDKGWLSGSIMEGFKLTAAGRSAALMTGKLLKDKSTKKKSTYRGKERIRDEAIVKYIEKTKEFRKYLLTGSNEISDQEARSFLRGTLETPKRILVHNYHIYFKAAERLSKKKILSFMKICKARLKSMER